MFSCAMLRGITGTAVEEGGKGGELRHTGIGDYRDRLSTLPLVVSP